MCFTTVQQQIHNSPTTAMFKFNFNNSEESKEDDKIKESTDNGEVIKESKSIEVTKDRYKEFAESFTNSTFDVFVSNETEIGFISLVDNRSSDLISGEYEGGFKIWECTQDLVDYFTSSNENEFSGKIVCDLGCSAGIAGIYALSKDAERVDFQDYNQDVLETFTIPNTILYCEENEKSESFQKCAFYSGDWDSFRDLTASNDKYDIILTSETIYNPKYYKKLLDFFKARLKDDGKIFLAAKSHYFGVGGNVHDFTKFLDDDGNFNSKVVWKSSEGLQREILLIKKNE